MPRCRILPQANHEVSFLVDGTERTRWHFGSQYPRPFFFPFNGPAGQSLTRMGHPGAPNHDHHQSIWFAHHKVLGMNFWGNTSAAHIRQIQWLAYEDGDDEARMATSLGWYDGHNPAPLITQELVAAIRPAGSGETVLEIQAKFVPTSASLEFQQTNFGFLGVRVASNISVAFGGGKVINSQGRIGGTNVHERPATWMDYSGSVADSDVGSAGITYVDHPTNIGQPTHWHVRDDGWMCASPGMKQSLVTTKDKPLTLRYLLLAHSGSVDAERANTLHSEFAKLPPFLVSRSNTPHTSYEITRTDA
jgi:hypothetical protein